MTMRHLTLADEIVVLMLDDSVGELKPAVMPVANVAIMGGVLMELSLMGRLDSDLQALFAVDTTPTGDSLLDDVLSQIATSTVPHPSTWWIETLSRNRAELPEQILERLATAGILRREDRRFLWFFSTRAYPPVSGQEEQEALARLTEVLFNNQTPAPRDTLLLGLAAATGALEKILSDHAMAQAAPRIADIVRLEEIGRAVSTVAGLIWDTQGPATIIA